MRVLALAGLSVVLLTGCRTSPPVQPTLTIAAAECPAMVDMSVAQPLVFDGSRSSREVMITADGACLQDVQGRKQLYTILRLPEAPQPYTVAVASPAQDSSVFALQMSLLDQQGNPVRELGSDTLMFRGGSLTGLFRPRLEERFLLISSNPDAVGKRFSRTQMHVNVNMIMVGTAAISVSSGGDNTTEYTFSHAGRITVDLTPISPSAN